MKIRLFFELLNTFCYPFIPNMPLLSKRKTQFIQGKKGIAQFD